MLCWAWQERIKAREIKPCVHLFVSVQSFNKPAEGSSSSHLFPQVAPWIYRIKFWVSWNPQNCGNVLESSAWKWPQNQSSVLTVRVHRLGIYLSELRAVLAALLTVSPGKC